MPLPLPGRAKPFLALKALLCLMWPGTNSSREFSPACSIGQALLTLSYTETQNKTKTPTKNSAEAAKQDKEPLLPFQISFEMCSPSCSAEAGIPPDQGDHCCIRPNQGDHCRVLSVAEWPPQSPVHLAPGMIMYNVL